MFSICDKLHITKPLMSHVIFTMQLGSAFASTSTKTNLGHIAHCTSIDSSIRIHFMLYISKSSKESRRCAIQKCVAPLSLIQQSADLETS